MFKKDKIPRFFFITFYNLGLLVIILAFIILAQKTLIEFEIHDKLQQTQNIIEDISKDINKTNSINLECTQKNKNTINEIIKLKDIYLINSKNQSFMTFVTQEPIQQIDKYYIKNNFNTNDYILAKTSNGSLIQGTIDFRPQGIYLTTNTSQIIKIQIENILGGIIAYDN